MLELSRDLDIKVDMWLL